MVTVVQGFNRGASIANAIGQGANSAMNSPMIQQDYQRNQLKSGLAETLKNMPPEMRQRLEPTMQLLSNFAGMPGSDRSLAAILPEYARQQAMEEVKRAPQPGGGSQMAPGQNNVGQANLPNFLGGQGQGQSGGMQQMPQPSPGQGSLMPTQLGAGLPQQKYTAQQIMENPRLAPVMQAFNEEQDRQASATEQRASASGSISQQRAAQQEEARQIFKQKGSDLSDGDQETLLRMRLNPDIQALGNYDEQYDAARKRFNVLDKSRYEMKRMVSDASSPEEFKRNLRTFDKTAQSMIKYGMRDELEGMLQKDVGLGPVNTAKIANNYTPEMYSKASALPSYDKYTQDVLSLPEFAPESEYVKLEKEKEKIDDKWKDWLKKTIKPGKYDANDPNRFKPGTSLLIARDLADQRQVPWQQFDDMVQDLVGSGAIELDDRQLSELAMLGRSPEDLEGIGEKLFNIGRVSGVLPAETKERRR